MSSDRPIFVLGCPRSGTTLLGLMIHAHPRLAMPPENRFLINAWRRRARFGDLRSEQQRRDLAGLITQKGSKIRDLGLKPAEVERLIVEGPPTMGSAFGIVFREYARNHGKARWGDKRPAYAAEVDVLLRLFPDAQIVHIIRDGRDNVASLKRMPWWYIDSLGSMATWALSEYCMRRDRKRLPKDTFHVVRYENLVADPRAVLQELCEFLDEEFDEAMLEPHKVRDVVPERKTWHQNLSSEVNSSAVESWRTGLEPWELGLMELVLGRALKRNGYELSGAGKRPTPRLVWRYWRTNRELRLVVRQRWAREAAEARRNSHPVAAQLTSRQLELAERG